MAMLTPAQKPRGLARMMRTWVVLHAAKNYKHWAFYLHVARDAMRLSQTKTPPRYHAILGDGESKVRWRLFP
jgi:hypothetical protein